MSPITPTFEPIIAPWTQEQVDGLNRYQASGVFHEFTCGTDSRHRALVATVDGWVCLDCPYRQDWAHAGMVLTAEQVEGFHAVLRGPDGQ